MSVATASAMILANDSTGKSGPIGLAVILVLCVACYFLFKSLSKHLKKVREEFPGAERPAADPTGDDVTTASAADSADAVSTDEPATGQAISPDQPATTPPGAEPATVDGTAVQAPTGVAPGADHGATTAPPSGESTS
jgi:hypothetical protein